MKRWAYCITTVPERRLTTLPKTLASLKAAGFDAPWLFVDGHSPDYGWALNRMTMRHEPARTFGNWWLSLLEMFCREPAMHYYAVFQDDFVTYPNLRAYLDKQEYPTKGYWNLYTFPCYEVHAPKHPTIHTARRIGFYEAPTFNDDGTQGGRGAVGLVFSRDAVMTLLSHYHMVARVPDPNRGHKAVDGAVVTAMNLSGWREYVHNPSLVQHMNGPSSMENKPHEQSKTFLGESFNALDLLARDCIG